MADVHEVTLTAPLVGLGAFTSASSDVELNLGAHKVAVSGCVRGGSPNFLPAALSDNVNKVVETPLDNANAARAAVAADAADAAARGAGDSGASDGASSADPSAAANASDANASAAAGGVGDGWGGFSGDELGAVLLGGLVPLAALPLASPMWQAPIFAAYNWLFDTSMYASPVNALVGSDLPHLGRATPLCRATFLASGQTLPGTLRIGAAEEAEVVLVDDGSEEANGVADEAADGDDAEAAAEAAAEALEAGEVAEMGSLGAASAEQLEVVADPLFPPVETVASWLEQLHGSAVRVAVLAAPLRAIKGLLRRHLKACGCPPHSPEEAHRLFRSHARGPEAS